MGAWFKTPITDIQGNLFTMQNEKNAPLCRAFEMQLYKCIEAKGVPNWRRECRDEYDDFAECHMVRKQRERIVVMWNERHRQYLEGKLPGDRLFLPNPPRFAYRAASEA